MELLFHAQQSGGLGFLKTHHGDSSPAADDERHFVLAEHGTVRLAVLLPLFLLAANITLQLALAIAERSRALEVLIANRLLLVHVHRIEQTLELSNCWWRGLRRQTRSRAGLVDDVDRLVGQEPVSDVALRQFRRRLQRRVGNRHLVVLLVFLAQTLEDLDSLIDRRRLDDDSLETTLEGSILLDVLAVLVQGRSADALQLAARQSWLEHVAGVDGAFSSARADQRVQLVDEQNDVLVLRDLVHDRLQALLELTAIFGARDNGRHVQRQHAIVAQRIGALAVGNELCESFDDRRLAYARLADEDWIVFLAAGEDLHHSLDFLATPDRWIELVVSGELGQIAAEMIERGSLRLLLSLARLCRGLAGSARGRRRSPALRHLRAEQAQGLRLGGVEVDSGVRQNLRRDSLLLAQQSEQQMLGADVPMT